MPAPFDEMSLPDGTSRPGYELIKRWLDAESAESLAHRRAEAELLFRRIGMDSAVFETDPRGTYAGSSNLYASARDWAKFGQLLLQDGVWKGERILPEGWVRWMRTPTEASGGEYGRQTWLHGPRANTPRGVPEDEGFNLPPDAFWMLGHDGQTITVIPSLRMVVVRMGLTPSRLGYKPQALIEALAKIPGGME